MRIRLVAIKIVWIRNDDKSNVKSSPQYAHWTLIRIDIRDGEVTLINVLVTSSCEFLSRLEFHECSDHFKLRLAIRRRVKRVSQVLSRENRICRLKQQRMITGTHSFGEYIYDFAQKIVFLLARRYLPRLKYLMRIFVRAQNIHFVAKKSDRSIYFPPVK